MADVSTPTREYAELAQAWKLPRTLMGGTTAMRAAGVEYLPQEAAESAEAYNARLKRSTLFNGFKKTVKDMTGKVFQKPIVIEKDVPAKIKEYAENIDNAGRHLNVFAKDVFLDGMQTGIGFILTEMPPPLAAGTGRNGEVTAADEQNANRRPYLCYIRAEQVIGWRSAIVDGVPTLTQVRIAECEKENDGDFGEKFVDQVRVLYRGRWEIWRKAVDGPNKDQWTIYQSGDTSLPYIPLAPVYINRIGFMQGEPPLEDLADLNVAHWQAQSDLRNIAHVANVPILLITGWAEDDTIEIGSSRACRSANAEANMQYVEHSGQAIGTSREMLKDLEFQMQVQGLQLLMPQPGGKTATGEVADDIKENSQLAMMATSLGDAIELSFGFMADFMGLGQKAGGSVKVNKDFGISAVGRTDLQQLIAAYSAGAISKETLWEEMQRRDFLSDSFDPDAETARIKEAAPVLDGPPMNLDPNKPPIAPAR